MQAYLQPQTLKEALALLSDEQAVVAAGCTDLFAATQAQQLAGRVLDVTRVGELRGISRNAEGWRIGGATTWSDLIAAPLPPAFDMLKAAAREVGSVQIQNSATLAGNLCNASPAADGVPPLLCLDAEVELSAASGARRMPLGDFITGPRQTQLADSELLSAIHVPDSAGTGQSRFLKLGARRYLVISIAMVAIRADIRNGNVADIALSVGSCSPVACRLGNLEQAMRGSTIGEAQKTLAAADLSQSLSPIGDIRASAAYRLESAGHLLNRAFEQLAEGTT